MKDIEERLDGLLAMSIAHRAVLQQLAGRTIHARVRNVVCREACDAFEQAFSATVLKKSERAHNLLQKAIHEIELILRDPSIRPESDGLAKK